jgi:hypothetical protein
LTNGAASAHAAAFAGDAFRTQILSEQDAERAAVAAFFAYQVAHTPRPDAVWSVRTEDGGAIVLAAFDVIRSFAVTAAGAKLPLPVDLAAMAGASEATQQATVTSLELVAFGVPPEGSEKPIEVLGGERGVLAATAS